MDNKKKLIKLIVISVLITIFLNILIYNFRIIYYHISGIEVDLSKHYLARFIAYAIIAYFFAKQYAGKNLFFILFVPVFLLDSTTLIAGRDLIPLRFPFDILYPLLGILCGMALHRSRLKFLIVFGISLIFMLVSEVYVRSLLNWYTREWSQDNNIENIDILSEKFKTIDNQFIVLSDTLNSKVKLVELYFVGCPPCEQKYEVLKELLLSNSDLKIAVICDGSITSYTRFLKHAKKNSFGNVIFLYDDKGFLEKQSWISGYPTELLYGNKQLINLDSGFGFSIKDRWLKKEQILINKILN